MSVGAPAGSKWLTLTRARRKSLAEMARVSHFARLTALTRASAMSPRTARSRLAIVRPAPRNSPPVAPLETDRALVLGVRLGDAKSKERLYRKHVDYIAGMCARLLRSIDASEDVTQDAFVIAFSKIHLLRDPEAFRGWLAAIAIHEIHRRLARQRLLRLFGLDRSLDDAPLDELARDDLSVEARSELAALDLVLQRLPPGQRIAWMLRYVEDEPLETVAEACRCSLATVKRWIAAADERVKEYVHIVSKEDIA
jgi:RNA polymerase sigma-70 factor, ECF subfamily